MTEQWKSLVDYEDLYRISDMGRAWSVRRNRIMPGSPSKNRGGYIEFCAVRDGKQRTLQMHREVYRAFNGDIPTDMQVRHLNGIRSDNRLENLAVGTAQDNQDDRRQEDYLGDKLLTQSQQNEILELAYKELSTKELAKRYGVCMATIYSVLDGKPAALRRQDIYKCIQNGAKVQLVAEYFGIVHVAVCAMMKRHYEPVRQLRKKYALNKSLTLDDIHRIIG